MFLTWPSTSFARFQSNGMKAFLGVVAPPPRPSGAVRALEAGAGAGAGVVASLELTGFFASAVEVVFLLDGLVLAIFLALEAVVSGTGARP